MANEQQSPSDGRLTSRSELKFTPTAKRRANFTIAQNARYFDKQNNDVQRTRKQSSSDVACRTWHANIVGTIDEQGQPSRRIRWTESRHRDQ